MYTTRLIRIRGFIQCPTPYFLFFSSADIASRSMAEKKKDSSYPFFFTVRIFFPGGNYCNFFSIKKTRWFFPRILRTNAQEIWTLYSFLGGLQAEIYVYHLICFTCAFERVKTTAPQNTREKYQLKLSKQGNRTIPRIKR